MKGRSSRPRRWPVTLAAMTAVVMVSAILTIGAWHHHGHPAGESDSERNCPICCFLHHAVFDLTLAFQVPSALPGFSSVTLEPVQLAGQRTPLLSVARAPPRAISL